MRDVFYNATNYDEDSDGIDIGDVLKTSLMTPVQQAAYWAGVPLTVLGLRSLIKSRNRKISRQFAKSITEDERIKTRESVVHREDEQFFRETYDPLSKSRAHSNRDLDELLRDIELENQVADIEDEAIRGSRREDLDTEQYRRHLEMGRREKEAELKRRLLESRTDIISPDEFYSPEFESSDPSYRAKEIKDVRKALNNDQLRFIELLESNGVATDGAYKTRSGNIMVKIKTSGLHGQVDTSYVEIPRMDATRGASAFDPRTATTGLSLEHPHIIQSGKPVSSTVVSRHGRMMELGGAIRVRGDSATVVTGPGEFLLMLTQKMRRMGKTGFNARELSKEWGRLLELSYREAGEQKDLLSYRSVLQVKDERTIEEMLRGGMPERLRVVGEGGESYTVSRPEREILGPRGNAEVIGWQTKVRANQRILYSYDVMKLLEDKGSYNKLMEILGETTPEPWENRAKNVDYLIGRVNEIMQANAGSNLDRKVKLEKFFSPDYMKGNTLGAPLLSPSQLFTGMLWENPNTVGTTRGLALTSTMAPQEIPARSATIPWSEKLYIASMNPANSAVREKQWFDPTAKTKYPNTFRMSLTDTKEVEKLIAPGQKGKVYRTKLKIQMPGVRTPRYITIESASAAALDHKRMMFTKFFNGILKVHEKTTRATGYAFSSKILSNNLNSLIKGLERIGENQGVITHLRGVVKDMQKSLMATTNNGGRKHLITSRVWTGSDTSPGVSVTFSHRHPIEEAMNLSALHGDDATNMVDQGMRMNSGPKRMVILRDDVAQAGFGAVEGATTHIDRWIPGSKDARDHIDLSRNWIEKNFSMKVIYDKNNPGKIDHIQFFTKTGSIRDLVTVGGESEFAGTLKGKKAQAMVDYIRRIQQESKETFRRIQSSRDVPGSHDAARNATVLAEVDDAWRGQLTKAGEPLVFAAPKGKMFDVLEERDNAGNIRVETFQGTVWKGLETASWKWSKQISPVGKNMSYSIYYNDVSKKFMDPWITGKWRQSTGLIVGSASESLKPKHLNMAWFGMMTDVYQQAVTYIMRETTRHGAAANHPLMQGGAATRKYLKRTLTETVAMMYSEHADLEYKTLRSAIAKMTRHGRSLARKNVPGAAPRADRIPADMSEAEWKAWGAWKKAREITKKLIVDVDFESAGKLENELRDVRTHSVSVKPASGIIDTSSLIDAIPRPHMRFESSSSSPRANTPIGSDHVKQGMIDYMDIVKDQHTDEMVRRLQHSPNIFREGDAYFTQMIDSHVNRMLPANRQHAAKQKKAKVQLLLNRAAVDEKAAKAQSDMAVSAIMVYDTTDKGAQFHGLATGAMPIAKAAILDAEAAASGKRIKADRRLLALMGMQNPIFAAAVAYQTEAGNEWAAAELRNAYELVTSYEKFSNLKATGIASIHTKNPEVLFQMHGGADADAWKRYNPFIDNPMIGWQNGELIVSNTGNYVDPQKLKMMKAGEDATKFFSMRDMLVSAVSGDLEGDQFKRLITNLESNTNAYGIRQAFEGDLNEALRRMDEFRKANAVAGKGASGQISMTPHTEGQLILDGQSRPSTVDVVVEAAPRSELTATSTKAHLDDGFGSAYKVLDPNTRTDFAFKMMSGISSLHYLDKLKRQGEVAKDPNRLQTISQLEDAIRTGLWNVVRQQSEYVQSQITAKGGGLQNKLWKMAGEGFFDVARSIETGTTDIRRFREGTGGGIHTSVGEATMTSETAMRLLMGGEGRYNTAKKYMNHVRLGKFLKKWTGIADDDLSRLKTTDEVMELLGRARDNSKSPTLKKALDNLMSDSARKAHSAAAMPVSDSVTKRIEDFLYFNTRLATENPTTLKQLEKAYRSVWRRVSDIKRHGAKEVIMMFRQPAIIPMDFRELTININDELKRHKFGDKVVVSTEDLKLTGGDQDGDFIYFMSRGFQNMFSPDGDKKLAVARADLMQNLEYYTQRALITDKDPVTAASYLQAANYTAERTLSTAMEKYKYLSFKNIREALADDLKSLTKKWGLSVTERNQILEDALARADAAGITSQRRAMYLAGTDYAMSTPELDAKLKSIGANGTLYEVLGSNDKEVAARLKSIGKETQTVANYKMKWDFVSEEARETWKKHKDMHSAYAKTVTDWMDGLDPDDIDRSTTFRRRADTYKQVQKLAAGTMFGFIGKGNMSLDLVLKMKGEDFLGQLQKGMAGSFGNAPLDRNFIDAMRNFMLKGSAEELSLQAKHGAPNMVEAIQKRLGEIVEEAGRTFRTKEEALTGAIPAGSKFADALAGLKNLDLKVSLSSEDVMDLRDPTTHTGPANKGAVTMTLGKYQDFLERRVKMTHDLMMELTGGKAPALMMTGQETGKPVYSYVGEQGAAKKFMNAVDDALLDGNIRKRVNDARRKIEKPIAGRFSPDMNRTIDRYIREMNDLQGGRGAYLHAAVYRDLEILGGIHRLKSKYQGTDPRMLESWARMQTAIQKDSYMRSYMEGVDRAWSMFQAETKGDPTVGLKRFLEHNVHGKARREGFQTLMSMSPQQLNEVFGIHTAQEQKQRIHDTITINPWRGSPGYSSAMRSMAHVGKAAIVGTFIAAGINQLISGYSIPDLERTEGLGGEYWEKKASKKAEMMIKPGPPRVEAANPAAMDRRREEFLLRAQNSGNNVIKTTDYTREQEYRHSGYGLKIR